MKFQTWIQIAKELMDIVHTIPKNYPEMIGEYNSQLFSIRHNPVLKSTTFKRVVPVDETVTLGQHVHQHSNNTSNNTSNSVTIVGNASNGTIINTPSMTIQAPLYNPNMTITTSDSNAIRYQVSMTVRGDEIIDLKFVRKNINNFSFNSDISEDGGALIHSMLYIGDEKMIHNGNIVDMNSPDAFTHDISTDTDISIMDLYDLKDYYESHTKNN